MIHDNKAGMHQKIRVLFWKRHEIALLGVWTMDTGAPTKPRTSGVDLISNVF
jgi:hypothetical protein